VGYLQERLWSYDNLYNVSMPDRSWFLWPFLLDKLDDSHELKAAFAGT
jgi:hypothetical protein